MENFGDRVHQFAESVTHDAGHTCLAEDEKARAAVEDAGMRIQHLVQTLKHSFDAAGEETQQVELTFGMKLDLQCGCAMMCKIGDDSDLKLQWTMKPPQTEVVPSSGEFRS
jgi:hypothetical protein